LRRGLVGFPETTVLRVAILAMPESWYYRDLARAAGDLRIECFRADFAGQLCRVGQGLAREAALVELVGLEDSTHPTNPPNVVLVRTMPPGSLEQVVFRMDALARLEAAGTRVINSPKSLECAVDKYLTTAKCAAAGLPVPDTIVCETEEAALAGFAELGGDVVVKPLFGAEGRGILRVSDPDLALRTFRTLSRLQAVLYLQRFIDHPGFDVRILVLNGEVLGGMRRFAANDDFRTNISRQATAAKHAPTPLESDLALRAVAATGAWVAGVDLLYDREGRCYVIEVNAVPGWRAFARANEVDIAAVLLTRIRSQSNVG
jgi:ribosomal protein S6--L-glutamate ligase